MNVQEDRLRFSLRLQARRAPEAGPVIDRVLAAVDGAPARPHRAPWRTWSLPVLAAAAIVALVVGVALTGESSHRAVPQQPAVSRSASVPTGTPAIPSSVVPAPSPSGSQSAPQPALHGFHAVDISFVGTQDGWVLGTAGVLCPGHCTEMMSTKDGGRSWHSFAGPRAEVALPLDACADPCVDHVRFATTEVGYLFGPQTLFMTTDGGASWQRLPGGAEALETLDGNVIRIVSDGSGCPGPCNVRAELSAIGGTNWTTVAIAAHRVDVARLAFARTGSDAYLLAMQHPAGGAQNQQSTLYVSHDDGAHWTSAGEPCPQRGGEADSTALTTAPDGALVVGCVERSTQRAFVVVSTDGGASFVARPPFGSAGLTLVGAASADRIFAMSDVLYASTDGGRSFRRVQQNSVGPLGAAFIGFETTTTGRILEADGSGSGSRTVWTTTDAGATWTPFTFPS